MSRRFLPHSLYMLALIGACTSQSPAQSRFDWPDSVTGKCYQSISDYVREEFPWTQEQEDENIRIVRVVDKQGGKSRYTWVMDTTPQINITRVLFSLSENGQVCAILTAPSTSSIDFELNEHSSLPPKIVTTDTPPPGYKARRIHYQLDKRKSAYYPAACEAYDMTDGNAAEVDCKHILDSTNRTN